VTVAYCLRALVDILICLALFAFGLIHTLPFLIVSDTDFGGARLFLVDTLDSLAYCFQPLFGSGH
jgi:hypothetical protein